VWHLSIRPVRSLGASVTVSRACQHWLGLMMAAGAVALTATACSGQATARSTQAPSGSQSSAATTRQSPPSSAGPAAPAFVPGAWPTVEELPFASVYRWQQEGPAAIVTADGEPLYTCDPATAIQHLNATAYQTVKYQRDPSTTNAGLSAALLFFSDSAGAGRALAQIRSDYASCAANSQHDTVTGETLAVHVSQTAADNASVAYVHYFRRSDHAPGSPEGVASDSHEYFAQRGNVLSFVRVSGGPTIDTPDGDSRVLQAMTTHLTAYQ
jgi:hypothetical protein